MRTMRTRWAALLGGGALTLTMTACTAEEEPQDDPTAGSVSQDSGTDGEQATGDAAAEETSQAPEAAEGEEVDAQEFMAMLQSPGEEMLSSYTMTMSVNMGGQAMEMEGAVDVSGESPALDVDMTLPGMGAVQMVMADGRVFMSMPGVTEEGKYLEVPEEQLGDVATQFDQLDITSTWDSWGEGAEQIVFVGEEDVDGQDMRRYEVTVDTEAAMEAAGETAEDAAEATAMPDEIVYDLWVDDDNLVRRIAFEMEGAVSEITTDNWGEPQEISAPAEEDIQQGGLGGPTSDS